MENSTTKNTQKQQLQTICNTKGLQIVDPKRMDACMRAALRILKESQPATATATADNAGGVQ